MIIKDDPRLFVVAGWKYEPEWLVEEMKENLKWADEICIVDTRHRTNELWINEGLYRKLQRKELEKAGIEEGDWVYVTSPDERLEKGAGRKIRSLIERTKVPTIYKFHLREMFTPTHYRVDGIWGRKTRPRLYPYMKGQKFSVKRIQQAPTPMNGTYEKRLVNINIYHLKNIEPESRVARAEAYKRTDPNYTMLPRNSRSVKRIDKEGIYEKLGYDYLADTEGMKLRKMPIGREFRPAYKRRYIFKIPTKS